MVKTWRRCAHIDRQAMPSNAIPVERSCGETLTVCTLVPPRQRKGGLTERQKHTPPKPKLREGATHASNALVMLARTPLLLRRGRIAPTIAVASRSCRFANPMLGRIVRFCQPRRARPLMHLPRCSTRASQRSWPSCSQRSAPPSLWRQPSPRCASRRATPSQPPAPQRKSG